MNVRIVLFENEVIGVYKSEANSIAQMVKDVNARFQEFAKNRPFSTTKEKEFVHAKFRDELVMKKAILK